MEINCTRGRILYCLFSIGPLSFYFATPLAFNAPDGGFPWDNLRKILHGGQRMVKVHSGREILLQISSPSVGGMNVTDDRRISDSKF